MRAMLEMMELGFTAQKHGYMGIGLGWQRRNGFKISIVSIWSQVHFQFRSQISYSKIYLLNKNRRGCQEYSINGYNESQGLWTPSVNEKYHENMIKGIVH